MTKSTHLHELENLADRMMSRMNFVDAGFGTDCWQSNRSTTVKGYAQFKTKDRRNRLQHRLAYELFVDDIPDGLVVDHLCRNRLCFNPDHLEVVTTKVNNLRGESPIADQARRTHCVRGHEFTAANTRIGFTHGGTRRHRTCKTCAAAWHREWNNTHTTRASRLPKTA